MSYALIDNATLTGVQRLLGQIETRSEYTPDSDLIALESLVQAILFYNKVVCIDDYKPEFRASRHKQFNFIDHLDPFQLKLERIQEIADAESQKMQPTIQGGEFVDKDFRAFLDQLKVNIICTWDISSSVYFLTMKMLGQPDSPEFAKYSTVSAAIFEELTDLKRKGDDWNDEVQLVDSRGVKISSGYTVPNARWGNGDQGGLSSGLHAFIAALNWLANRTIYYSLAARYLHADTFLHPIRSAFQLNYMRRCNVYGYDFTKQILKKWERNTMDAVSAIVGNCRSAAAICDLPMFSSWLVNETSDVSQVLEAAVELRKDPEFAEARFQLMNLREAVDDDDLATINKKVTKTTNSLNKTLAQVKRRFGLKEPQAAYPVSSLVAVYNASTAVTKLPKMPAMSSLRLPLPEFVEEALTEKGFAQIYRNVAKELPSVWKMGDAHKKLTGQIRRSKDPSFSPRTEDPQYRRAHSYWKSPM